MAEPMITVIDVMRDMRVELTPQLTWSVGAQVRDLWFSITGKLPTKELRPKTYMRGVHCLATYPPSMRPHIERIVNRHLTNTAKQMNLFAAKPTNNNDLFRRLTPIQ